MRIWVLVCLVFLISQYTFGIQTTFVDVPENGARYTYKDSLRIVISKSNSSQRYRVVLVRQENVILDSLIDTRHFSWFVTQELLMGQYQLRVSDFDGNEQEISIEIGENNSLAYHYEWSNVTWNAEYLPRDGAGLLKFKNKYWLLGGWNPYYFEGTTTSEIWSSDTGESWNLETVAPWEGRHVVGWVIFKDAMWVVGGDNIRGHYINDIWKSIDGLSWEMVSDSIPIPRRLLHMVTVYNEKMYIMGGEQLPLYGTTDDRNFSDVWSSSDGISWSLEIEHAAFGERGMLIGDLNFKDSLWIVGGGEYDPRVYMNDVWSSGDGVNWVSKTDTAAFPPRQYHNITTFDNKLWVTGGYNGSLGGNQNDVWFSDDGIEWRELPFTPWYQRHAHSTVADDESLLLLGGPLFMSDVWKLYRAVDSVVLNTQYDTMYLPLNSSYEAYTSRVNGFSYQWYHDNSPVEANPRMVIHEKGSYHLKVKDLSGKEVDSKNLFVSAIDFDLVHDSLAFYTNDSIDIRDLITSTSVLDQLENYSLGNTDTILDSRVVSDTVLHVNIKIRNTNFSDSIEVHSVDPVVTTIGSHTLFPGEKLVASVQKLGGYQYHWFKNDSLFVNGSMNEIEIFHEGRYYLEILRRNHKVFSSDTLIVRQQLASQIPGDTTVIFEGDSLTAQINLSKNYTYKLVQNDSVAYLSDEFNIFEIGAYHLEIFDDEVKVYTSSKFYVTVLPVEINSNGDSVLFPGDGILLSVENLQGYSYQWFKNGSFFTDQTGSNLEVNEPGNYICKIYKGAVFFRKTKQIGIGSKIFQFDQPDSIEIFQGDTISLTSTFYDDVYYEWKVDSAIIKSGVGINRLLVTKPGIYSLKVYKEIPGQLTLNEYAVGSTVLKVTKATDLEKNVVIPSDDFFELILPPYFNTTINIYRNGFLLPGIFNNRIRLNEQGLYIVDMIGTSSTVRLGEMSLEVKNFEISDSLDLQSPYAFNLSSPYFYNSRCEWFLNNLLVERSVIFSHQTNSKGKYHAELISSTGKRIKSNTLHLNDFKEEFSYSIENNGIRIEDKSEYIGPYHTLLMDLSGKEIFRLESTKNSIKLNLYCEFPKERPKSFILYFLTDHVIIKKILITD